LPAKIHLLQPRKQIEARKAWSHAHDGLAAGATAIGGTSVELPAAGYPAFYPDAPRLVTNGGPHLTRPHIVTITWDGDPGRDLYEAFDDQLGASDYWRETMKEFGVGATISGPKDHVRISTPFGSMTDVTMDAWVQQNALGKASGWPQNTDQTIYNVFLPPNANYTLGGAPACQVAGGYHSWTTTAPADGGPTPPSVIYAINFNCSPSYLDSMTLVAAHELGEASTDPLGTGLVGFDADHAAYGIYQAEQTENGDACEFFAASTEEEPPPFDFTVQRLWSNASVLGGHNPCLPLITGEAYYNTATFPSEMDAIHIDLSATGWLGPVKTKGVKVPLGHSRTFDVGFYSDAPTGPWTLQAVIKPMLPVMDQNGNPIPNGDVDVTIDRATGSNGHIAHVTVTPKTAGPIGAEYIELQSGHAEWQEGHTLPILIGQK
jgi:hypothetical protein